MKYLKIFVDFREDIAELSFAEKGRLLDAMLDYADNAKQPVLSGNERFVWHSVKKQIDNQRKSYENLCETNKRIATERYAPSRSVTERDGASRSVTERNGASQEQDKDKDKEKDSSVCVNSISSNPAHAREDTHTPTRDEIHAFCIENGINIDEEKFYLTYSSNGWKDANGNPVGDWRNRVLLWNHGDKERKAAGRKRASNDNAFSTFDTDEFFDLAMKRTFHEE